MRILADADVPNRVGEFLQSREHEVVRSRDVLPPESPDPLIAQMASDLRAVVLTWNRRDFLSLARRRRGPHGGPTYPGMHLITFDNCSHVEGLRRLRTLIDDIEIVYENRVVRREQRMIVVVGRSYLRLDDLE